ncbi:MAG: dihydropteroate synthase [Deltaproteobacteria bacterium]|nr:MAG: dihydropteroate synthase [Deltaproteobacteria bacterium]
MRLLVRTVPVDSDADLVALARRVGIAESRVPWAAQALGRPACLLLTHLPEGAATLLRQLAGPPEREGAGPRLLTGGGEAAVLAGSRWELFSLASRLAALDHPAAAPLSEAMAHALASTKGPPREMEIGGRRFDFGRRTWVMGILNVTPDSFSDGGRYLDEDAAVARGEALLEEGADLLDIGGESTRPGAAPVEAEEEQRRVVPVVRRLAAHGVPISVDTTKASVARAALDAGAAMVNDVSGLERDPEMAQTVADAGVPVVLMHMRGTPATMQAKASYRDLLEEVMDGLLRAMARARDAGIDEAQIVVDPGIGFAKRAPHTLALLRDLESLATLGRPILVGASRKSFIGAVCGAEVGERLPGSLAAAVLAAEHGAHFLRVHDVKETRQALAVFDAVRGEAERGEAFGCGSSEARLASDARLRGGGT